MLEYIKILAIVILGQVAALRIYLVIESWVEERRAKRFAKNLQKQKEKRD